MKRIWMLALVLILLLPVMSCKKEAPEINQSKIVLSSGQWVPGEIYYDEDFYYWMDPELWNEPLMPEEFIKGPKNLFGYLGTEELIDPETGQKTVISLIICPSAGNVCGRLLYEVPGGPTLHVGFYIEK